MKKITLMLALLGSVFTSVQTAFADEPNWEGKRVATLSEAVSSLESLSDGYYVLRNVGRKTFLREDSNHNLNLWNATNGSDELTTVQNAFVGKSTILSSVVYVSKNEGSDKYTMTFKSGQYLGASLPHGTQASSSTTAGEIEFSYAGESQFNFRPTGSEWANGNGSGGYTEGSFTGWDTTTPGAGGNGAYQFFPVTLEDNPVVSVTWTVKNAADDSTVGTFTTSVDKGTTVTLPDFEKSYFFTDATLVTPENTTVTDENNAFTINVTVGEAPYTASTAAAPVWYNIKFRNDEAHYLNHVLSSDNGIGTQRTNTKDFFTANGGVETFNGGMWAFVSNGLGVKLLNKQTGKYVKTTTTNGAAASLVADAEATTFLVKTNSYNDGGAAGFSLQVPGDTKAFVGDHAAARLGTWNPGTQADAQNDGGSCFQIALADTEENLTIGKELLTAALDALTPNEEDATYATAGTQASIDAAKASVDAITSVNAIDNNVSNFGDMTVPVFDANAYYRIVNVNSINKKYVSSAPIFVGTDGKLATSYNAGLSGDRVVRRVTANDAFVPQLWQFINNGNNTFKIKNANTGCRLSSNAGADSNIDMPINENAGGDYTIKVFPSATFSGNDGKTMAQLIINGKQLNAYQGDNNTVLYHWDNANDKGGYWQFEKVTEVPVAISEANYATVGFPFAVQVPAESGVKAFYVSSIANGTIALTEIENGIIPANQGAILYHDGATSVNLAITSTDATIKGNLLTATAAKRVGYEADANYLLALNEAGNAAFLQSSLTSVPANKAFISSDNIPVGAAAATLNFVFDGTTTGINGVQADNENNTEYFDLSGRRVLYPANGIFVTKAGKKVFIK